MEVGNVTLGNYSGNTFLNTPQLQEERRNRRRGHSPRFRLLCVVSFVLAVMSVVFGALQIYLGYPEIPYVYPPAIIAGILMIIGSIFGFKASELALEEEETSNKTRGFVMVHYLMSVISVTFCGLSVVTAAIGVGICKDCDSALVSVEVVCIVNGLLLGTCTMIGSIFFCCYARAFGFKSRAERAVEYHIAAMQALQMQQQTAMGNQTQQPFYNYGFGYPTTQGQTQGTMQAPPMLYK